MPSRVVVAMSGGVDSTIAAHLLQRQGHQVVGLHMVFGQVAAGPGGPRLVSPGSADAARRAARAIGVECQVLDCRDEFWGIVRYFCESYDRGLTPNPCVRCNPTMKFRTLCAFAHEVGAETVATGHYARVACIAGRHTVQRGLDPTKDQSYVLHRLSQEQLARAAFPLGEQRKADVRSLAQELGLDVAHRPGSQEVCFAPGRDHTELLRALSPGRIRPGPIKDTAGRVVGEHPGIQFFTIGQRRGLGVALGTPRYVVAIDPEENAVVIGTQEEACRQDMVVRDVNWVGWPCLDGPAAAQVQIRYNHQAASASLAPAGDGRVCVHFHQPQPAITPGQAAVFYEGPTVLGGGWIER